MVIKKRIRQFEKTRNKTTVNNISKILNKKHKKISFNFEENKYSSLSSNQVPTTFESANIITKTRNKVINFNEIKTLKKAKFKREIRKATSIQEKKFKKLIPRYIKTTPLTYKISEIIVENHGDFVYYTLEVKGRDLESYAMKQLYNQMVELAKPRKKIKGWYQLCIAMYFISNSNKLKHKGLEERYREYKAENFCDINSINDYNLHELQLEFFDIILQKIEEYENCTFEKIVLLKIEQRTTSDDDD